MSTIPGDDSRIGLLYERDGPLCTAANDSKLPSVACRIVFTTFPTGFKSDDENRISKTPPPSALCANLTTRVDCGNNQEPYKCYNNDLLLCSSQPKSAQPALVLPSKGLEGTCPATTTTTPTAITAAVAAPGSGTMQQCHHWTARLWPPDTAAGVPLAWLLLE